jgi:nitrogen fixation-related uncharacterized protein
VNGRRDLLILAAVTLTILLWGVVAYRAGQYDERQAWEAAAAEDGDINPDPCPGYAAR